MSPGKCCPLYQSSSADCCCKYLCINKSDKQKHSVTSAEGQPHGACASKDQRYSRSCVEGPQESLNVNCRLILGCARTARWNQGLAFAVFVTSHEALWCLLHHRLLQHLFQVAILVLLWNIK